MVLTHDIPQFNVDGWEIKTLMKKVYGLDVNLSDPEAFLDGNTLHYSWKIYKFHRNSENRHIFITFDWKPVEWEIKDWKVSVTIGDRMIDNVLLNEDWEIQSFTSMEFPECPYSDEPVEIFENIYIHCDAVEYSDDILFYKLFNLTRNKKSSEYEMQVNWQEHKLAIAWKEVEFSIETTTNEDEIEELNICVHMTNGNWIKVDLDENYQITWNYEIEGISYLSTQSDKINWTDELVQLLDMSTGELLKWFKLFHNGEHIALDNRITLIYWFNKWVWDVQYKGWDSILDWVTLDEWKWTLSTIVFEWEQCIIWKKTCTEGHVFVKLFCIETWDYLWTKVLIGEEYKNVYFKWKIYDPNEKNIDFNVNDIDQDWNIVIHNYNWVEHIINRSFDVGGIRVYTITSLADLDIQELVSYNGIAVEYKNMNEGDELQYYTSSNNTSHVPINLEYVEGVCYLDWERLTEFELGTRLSKIWEWNKTELVMLIDGEFVDITLEGDKKSWKKEWGIDYNRYYLGNIQIESDGKIKSLNSWDQVYIPLRKIERSGKFNIRKYSSQNQSGDYMFKVLYHWNPCDITLNGEKVDFTLDNYKSLCVKFDNQKPVTGIDINDNWEIVTQEIGGKICYFVLCNNNDGTSLFKDSKTHEYIWKVINIDGTYCEVKLKESRVQIKSYIRGVLDITIQKVYWIPDGKYQDVKFNKQGAIIIEEISCNIWQGVKNFAKIGHRYFFKHNNWLIEIISESEHARAIHQAFMSNAVEIIL